MVCALAEAEHQQRRRCACWSLPLPQLRRGGSGGCKPPGQSTPSLLLPPFLLPLQLLSLPLRVRSLLRLRLQLLLRSSCLQLLWIRWIGTDDRAQAPACGVHVQVCSSEPLL